MAAKTKSPKPKKTAAKTPAPKPKKVSKTAGAAKTVIAKKAAAKPAKPAAGRLVLYGFHRSMPTGKVALLLAMLGAPYEYRHIDLRAGAHKAADYAKIARFGQVPALVDGDEIVVQSNVILQYLAEKFGAYGGKTAAEKRRVAEWLAWDFDKLTTLGQVRFLRATQLPGQPPIPALAFLEARARMSLEFLDRHLGANEYVAGTVPTIADVAIFAWIAVAEEAGFDPAHFPNLRAWAMRMVKLPGVAHPYALMPTEDKVPA